MENIFNLTGKVALITGASSGIGKACAIALANQGAKVALAARRIDKLKELAASLSEKGREVLPIQIDVTKKEEITAGVSQVVATFGRLDILVNNAGIAEFTPFLEITEEAWDKTLDTNLKGYFLVAQAGAREMAKNKWGRIVNIASIAMGGVGVGFSNIAHYCASKGGVVALTESLACELAPMGILVNCIAPGVIETEMTKSIVDNPEQLRTFLPRIPLNRIGKPEEIASAVVYLSSEEASYITGATLVVDGGWLAK